MDNQQQTAAATQRSQLLHNMLAYAGEYKLPFIIAVLFAIFGSVASIVGPDQLSAITDIITDGLFTSIDLEAVSRIAVRLAIIYAAGIVMSYGQGYIMATITQKFSKKLREAISTKINRLPLKYFDSHSQGDTLSRVTNDLDTVGQSLNQSLGTLVSSLTLFIGCLFMMFKTNVILSVTAIASVMVGFLLMMLIMSKSQVHFDGQQKNLAAVNGFVEEAYSGHSVITSYNAGAKIEASFQQLNHTLYNSVWKSQFLSGMMQPLMGFIGNFGYVVVCVVGAVLALQGTISFGVIVAFMVYVRLFSQPLSQLAQAFSSLQSAEAAMNRVFEFLDEEEMADEAHKENQLAQVRGHVEFRQVNFGYDDETPIIKNFSAAAKPGQKIAIVGPTGAGKTTIVNLLMKFYEVTDGEILIDHVSISDMKREEVHDQFCMVLQDTWLFEGTIKQNLIYNQKNISDEQVIAACKAVGIHHFIQTLSKGYETVLDDKVALSVGQRQLLTIARALIKDAPMLILDEATSSVDTRTEELIQQAMDTLMEGRTSFVIAHRLSTIRNADLILVMQEGNIIESGNHNELMVQQGFYADLYNSQFEK